MTKRRYIDGEIRFIEQQYGKMPLEKIAQKLGRTKKSLISYCRRMRIKTDGRLFSNSHRFYNRYWTDLEDEYLINNIGIMAFSDIGKALHRTAVAVEVRVRRKKMKMYDNIITYRMLAEELNKNRVVLRKYVRNGWLKCTPAKFKGLFNNVPMVFNEDDIVAFLRERYQLFDPNKIPNPFFKNIIREAYKKNHGNKYVSYAHYGGNGHMPPTKLEFCY